MSWPRVSLLASLFFIALPQAFADAVIVGTTKDDASDTVCTLRHAVEYFNEGRPEAGWKGCKRDGDATSSDSITLANSLDNYEVNGAAIRVRTDRNLSITGGGTTGDSVTRIKVGGNFRVFVVSNNSTYDAPACSTSSSCQPAGAPPLDPASDTGASTTDFLTTVLSPSFNGAVSAPVDPTHSVRVILYAKRADATEKKKIAEMLADPSTFSWNLKPSEDLAPGEYGFTYTKQLLDSNGNKVGDEIPGGGTTTLRIYNDSANHKTLSLTNLILEGCGSAASCALDLNGPEIIAPLTNGLTLTNALTGTSGNGGVIFSTENISLSGVILSKGGASGNGGGIYIAGSSGSTLSLSASTLSDNKAGGNGGAIFANDNTVITMEGTLLKKNEANSGAAIYAESNSVGMTSSVAIENKATAPAGAAIHVASGTVAAGSTSVMSMTSSTISGNTGWAMVLPRGTINSSTIVENTLGGISFENSASTSGIHNTILAGNGSTDCANMPVSPGVLTMTYSLVDSSAGCPTTGNGMQTYSGALMATSTDDTHFCDSTTGILCPLSVGDKADNLLPFHLPRVLSSYADAADFRANAKIINKGAGSNGAASVSCSGTDQRGKTRGTDATDYCDIGAVEVKATTDVARSGGSISYTGVYKGSIAQGLGDEELFRPSAALPCPASPPSMAATPTATQPTYWPNVPGCPWLETIPPRGRVDFNAADETYSYTPHSPFHGYDEFNFRVMTALSRLNDEDSLKGRPVLAKVIVEPTTGISNSTLGGSFGFGVLGLLIFLGLARKQWGQ